MNLDGKTTVVTGAANGIGAALARRFHAAGARVVVADRDAKNLQVIEADKEYYDIQQKVADHHFEWMLAYDGLELDI